MAGGGEGLQVNLLPEGPLDAAFVERQLTSYRQTLGGIEVLEKRPMRLSVLRLVYFATDELGRNWVLMYTLRREHVARWRPRLEQIESRPH